MVKKTQTIQSVMSLWSQLLIESEKGERSSRRSFVHWTVSDKAKVLLHHQAVQVALQPNGGIGCPETRKPAASGPFYVLQIRYSKG